MTFRSGTFIIGAERKLVSPLSDLTILPTFIRFENVKLFYCFGSQTIEEKHKLFEAHSLSLKTALSDSTVVEFQASISQGTGHFRDHSHFLDHFRHQFLPICNSSCSYAFNVHFYSDKNAVTNVIASLLWLPELRRCSSVEVRICYWKGSQGQQTLLPIEMISNWLEKSHGAEMNVRKKKENFLKIRVDGIQNAREMIDHLQMVLFFMLKHLQLIFKI